MAAGKQDSVVDNGARPSQSDSPREAVRANGGQEVRRIRQLTTGPVVTGRIPDAGG